MAKNDFVRLKAEGGDMNMPLSQLGLHWPPPEELEFLGMRFKKVRQSQLTDEQAEELSGAIMRGAEYELQTQA